MKTRNDFVSNSSSCSFVIANPAKAAEVFSSAFGKIYIPYEYDDKINISLEAKNKNFKEVETDLKGQSDYSDTFTDFRDGSIHVKDPDIVGWDRIGLTMSEFAEAGKHMRSYEKTEVIQFECEDYDIAATNLLKQLYDFFERNDCKPSAENSEMEFMAGSNCEFLQRLVSFKSDSAKPEII